MHLVSAYAHGVQCTPSRWYLNKIPPEKLPLNAVECEPVPTRVFNPNASEGSYKPKQRSYRKTKLHFFKEF